MSGMKIEKNRTFSDSWMFFLFLLLTIGTNAWFFSDTTHLSEKLEDLSNYKDLFIRLACCYILIFLLTISLIYLGFKFSKATILSFYFLFQFLCIGFTVFFLTKQQEYVVISIIIIILNIFFNVFYFSGIYNYRNVYSNVLKISCKLLLNNFKVILMIQFFTLILSTLSFLPQILCIEDDSDVVVFYCRLILLALQVAWMDSIFYYFLRHFVASITISNIAQQENSLSQAFLASFYALGSISYSALILPIINLLRKLVDRKLEKIDYSKDVEKENIKISFEIPVNFYIVFYHLLVLLFGSYRKYLNSLVYACMAVQGSDFYSSLENSFFTYLKAFKGSVVSSLVIDHISLLINSIFFVVFFLIYLPLRSKLIDTNSNATESMKALTIFSFIICFLAARRAVSLIKSSCYSIIYAALEHPSDLENFDKEASEIIHLKDVPQIQKNVLSVNNGYYYTNYTNFKTEKKSVEIYDQNTKVKEKAGEINYQDIEIKEEVNELKNPDTKVIEKAGEINNKDKEIKEEVNEFKNPDTKVIEKAGEINNKDIETKEEAAGINDQDIKAKKKASEFEDRDIKTKENLQEIQEKCLDTKDKVPESEEDTN